MRPTSKVSAARSPAPSRAVTTRGRGRLRRRSRRGGYHFCGALLDATTPRARTCRCPRPMRSRPQGSTSSWSGSKTPTIRSPASTRGVERRARAPSARRLSDGQPPGRPIYFATIDFDAQPSQQRKIDAYLRRRRLGLAPRVAPGSTRATAPTKRLFDDGTRSALGLADLCMVGRAVGRREPSYVRPRTRSGVGDVDADEAMTRRTTVSARPWRQYAGR